MISRPPDDLGGPPPPKPTSPQDRVFKRGEDLPPDESGKYKMAKRFVVIDRETKIPLKNETTGGILMFETKRAAECWCEERGIDYDYFKIIIKDYPTMQPLDGSTK